MDAEVIVIGGGPVGLALGIELGQRGRRVVVVERHAAITPIPKGQNLTQRTGEHFRHWGVAEAIAAATPIPPDHGSGGLTAWGTLFGHYSHDWHRRASVAAFYAAGNARIPQYLTEQVLRDRLATLPGAQLRLDSTVTGLDQDAEGVTVTLNDGRDSLRAAFAVGCDGAGSPTRRAAGIPLDIDSRDRRMALVVFRSETLDRLVSARYPGKAFFNVLVPRLQGYWQFLGRVDLDHSFFFHAPVPDGTTAATLDVPALLQGALGAAFEVELRHLGFWDLRFAHARSYRAGRVFLAGDSAHAHPPYGGYGINTGFEDARNLGWKLDAALAGWAGPGLLDSYSAERHPVFASTRDDFIARMIADDADFVAAHDPERDRAGFEAAWAARAAGGDSGVAQFRPQYEGSPLVFGPAGGRSGAVGTHDHAARAGHHLSPRPLADGRSSFDRLGAGFTLFDRGLPAAGALARAAKTRGLTFDSVDCADAPATADWRARGVLARPDGFVAWAGDVLPTTPAALIARVAGG